MKNLSISSYSAKSSSPNSANSVLYTDFIHTQLNVKTVLYQTNQFRISKVSMSKNSSILNNSNVSTV